MKIAPARSSARTSRWSRSSVSLRLFAVAASLVALAACHSKEPPRDPLVELRREAPRTSDPEVSARWLLSEMISSGGDAARARQARARLDSLGKGGMFAALARGLDDGVHGRPQSAADHYLEAVGAARAENATLSPLVAWFAANRAVALARGPELWAKWRASVEAWIRDPRAMGWRARGELVEWAIDQAWTSGVLDVDRRAVREYGCLSAARLAGPFGHGAALDATRSFPAERPGPWPSRWDPDPGVLRAARVFDVEARSCAIQLEERPDEGVFYVETFFEVPEPREVLLAVQGALVLFVDDQKVVERDVRTWGVWPKFGVGLRLSAGRHRVVARLSEPSTSVRLMNPDGTPLGAASSRDPAPGYGVVPPEVLPDPNVLVRWVDGGNVRDPGDDVVRFFGGFLAHVESSDDVASVLAEPLLAKTDRATGPSLALAALFAEGDPIFESSQAKDLVRELHERASRKDPSLWASRLSLALSLAEQKGAAEAVSALRELAALFPEVPEIALSLARLYGELGWDTEHAATVKELVARFPNDLGALHAAVDVLESEGDTKQVDELVLRIQKLDRDDEIGLGRALAREDYAAAIAELERLARAHPDREEILERIHDAKVRAGQLDQIQRKLEAAVKKEPTNPRARLDLADARYAAGDPDALHRGLADAVQAGANPSQLANAIDLVEGVTELEPYRLDASAIIRAYEEAGKEMPGTAARLLDYAALWIRADGSSRMLEHEIVRVQSAEAITSFAEHRMPEGLVLHLRVIKKDGSTFEPEFVSGKATVTLPHLEVGDYIETEQVIFAPGDSRGTQYNGPRWFFREENVAYARSEFVVVSPENKDLVVETTGNVPAPVVERKNGLVTRRFRVDFSPAAVAEPGSPPVSEFLPSVRIGWGVTLERRLSSLRDVMSPVTPVDPRILRIAKRIVHGTPRKESVERARKLYRWLLDNVEPGDETDGRRVLIGKHGNLWHGFRMLCRAAGVDVRYAVAESRLATPPTGPLSLASHFTQPVAFVAQGRSGAWLTLGNKYAPFGYVPAELRGMPAYWLDGPTNDRTTVLSQGKEDRILFSGKGKLDAKGALTIDLVEEFSGRLAMALRHGLSQVPEQQLRNVIESNLLAQTLRGGELLEFSVERREDLDSSLVIRMSVKVPRFALPGSHALILSPPMAPDLGRLATLPSRQTPLLVGEALHRTVTLDIELPGKASADPAPPASLGDGDRRVTIEDRVKGGTLQLRRTIDIPAGRVQPSEYARFARFAREADDALSRQIHVRVP